MATATVLLLVSPWPDLSMLLVGVIPVIVSFFVAVVWWHSGHHYCPQHQEWGSSSQPGIGLGCSNTP
jgi:hypothetical protein